MIQSGAALNGQRMDGQRLPFLQQPALWDWQPTETRGSQQAGCEPRLRDLYDHAYSQLYTDVHTLHYISVHYITLHYMTLHYITLQYITLHYIYIHT